jgi:hypothetical protein
VSHKGISAFAALLISAVLLLRVSTPITAGQPTPIGPPAGPPRGTPEIPSGKEGEPRILLPEESAAAAIRLRIDCYIFDWNEKDRRGPKLFVLQPAKDRAPPDLGPNNGSIPKPLNPPEKTNSLEAIPIAGLDGKVGMRPARQPRPARMALIVASFPYRKQVEEFRRALRLSTMEEVLAARMQAGPDKTVPSFRFLGVEVERRVLDGARKPASPWAVVNLQEGYRPWMLLTGKGFEPDAPLVAAVSPAGLVMPRLHAWPRVDVNPYPNLEEDLPTLAQAMKEAEQATKTGRRLPGAGKEALDPFAPGPEKGPLAPPAGKKDLFIPEHCLLRLIDPTIESGKTYQYRLRVRMGNPSTKGKDAPAKDDGLRSARWYEVPHLVALPPDVAYYAVDPQESRPRERVRPPVHDPARQTLLEIHHWLDTIRVDGEKAGPLAVGDWAIADNVIVTRGEPVRATQDIQLPVWSSLQDAFILATDSHGRKREKETIRVFFGNERMLADDLVVDFDGGAQSYQPSPQEARIAAGLPGRISDVGPREILLMTAEGKLLGHNSAADSANPERIARREAVRKMIDILKKPAGDSNPFKRP